MAEFLSVLVMIGLVALSVAMWRQIFIADKNGQPHLLSLRDAKIAPLGFIDVIAAVLIAASSQVFAISLSMLLMGIREFDFTDVGHMTVINYVAGTAQFIAAFLTLLYLFNRYGDVRAAGLAPGSLTQDLKFGFYGFLLFVPPMLLLQSVLTNFWEYEHPTMEMVSPDSSLLAIVSAWWTATIVAPVSEEILFRVVLLGWLLRCFANPNDFVGGLIGGKRVSDNSPAETIPAETIPAETIPAETIPAETIPTETIPVADYPEEINPYASSAPASIRRMKFQHQKTWAPVLIVTLLFAVVHIGQGPAPIPIFFLGLGLCAMYRQTGSVVPCIVTHFLLNTFSMTVFTIEQFFLPAEEGLTEEGLAVPAGIVDFLANFIPSII